MVTKRGLFVVLVVVVVAMTFGIQAQISARETAQSAIIPYLGHLTDTSGQIAPDGDYDFTFALYDAPTGGEALWSEVQKNIAVQGGNLVASLGYTHPIPEAALNGGNRWVAVGVRGPGEGDFTILTPRQRLSATAPVAADTVAASVCTHDHWGESWNGTGNGLNLSTSDGYSIGLFGENTATSGAGYGVMGKSVSPEGFGVKGINNSSGVAVSGYSSNGIAISAEGTGIISSVADSILYLSPHELISRGSTNVTLTPLQGGGILIHNDAGSGVTKYFSIPVSTFGTLYGAQVYVKSLEICYKVGTWTSIEATTVSKSDDTESGETFYIRDLTSQSSATRACYTLDATTRLAIDNTTWVQFNISFAQPNAEATIYKAKLTVTETQ